MLVIIKIGIHRRLQIEIDENDLIMELKRRIEKQEGIDVCNQCLMSNGRELSDKNLVKSIFRGIVDMVPVFTFAIDYVRENEKPAIVVTISENTIVFLVLTPETKDNNTSTFFENKIIKYIQQAKEKRWILGRTFAIALKHHILPNASYTVAKF